MHKLFDWTWRMKKERVLGPWIISASVHRPYVGCHREM